MAQSIPTDFTVTDHGSIILLRPLTPEARDWVDEYLPADAQWHGRAIAVERRYFEDIYDGLTSAGLTIS